MNGVFNGRNDIGSDDEEDEEQQEEEDDEEAVVEEDVDVAAAAAAAAGSRCRWWCRGRILGSLWGYSNLKHTHLSHVSL